MSESDHADPANQVAQVREELSIEPESRSARELESLDQEEEGHAA